MGKQREKNGRGLPNRPLPKRLRASADDGRRVSRSGRRLRQLALEQLERRELLSIQPVATPFVATAPVGSMAYHQETAGEIAASGEVDRFSVDLGTEHTFSLSVDASGDLRPTIEVYDSNNALLGTSTASSVAGTAALETVAAAGNGTYTVAVQGTGGTTGEYTFRIDVNAALEDEEIGETTNDSRATAENLESAFVTFASGSLERASVVGTLTGFGENFESGRLDGSWTTSTSEPGIVEVSGYAGTGDGTYALMMHYRSGGEYETGDLPQTATWTVDLSTVDTPTLSFSHRTFYSDQYDPFESDFDDSYNADGVAISDDGVHWHPISTYDSMDYDNWVTETVDLAAEANTAGMQLGESFQIRFQQYHESTPRYSLSGRGFDQVMITSEPDEDWYEFSLGDGETASITVARDTYGDATVELYDDHGTQLASGVPADNTDWVISNFQDVTSDGASENYYVRISGVASDYQLIVLREADFEASSVENGFAEPRYLVPGRIVQGAVYQSMPGGPSDAEPVPVDVYALAVVAGDNLQIETIDLPDKPFWYPEQFNPELELRDPAGNVVAADRNGAADGLHALIQYEALETGTYTVHVRGEDGAQGEYALSATGHSGGEALFRVRSTTADTAGAVTDRRSFEVDFSDNVLLGSLGAGDLKVDGVPATSVTVLDGNTARFQLASTILDGPHMVTLAAGALVSADHRPLADYAATFDLDTTAPRITSSSLSENDHLGTGSLVVSLTFSETLDPASIDESGISLIDHRGRAQEPLRVDYVTATRTLKLEFAEVWDGDYTLTITSGDGHFLDPAANALDGERHASATVPTGNGAAGGDFVVHFSADTTTLPLDSRFHAAAPYGSLIQTGEVRGFLATTSDVDAYSVTLDGNQKLTLAVVPDDNLQPIVSLYTPSGNLVASSTATGAGCAVRLAHTVAAAGGTYRIEVAGMGETVGDYRVDVLLNATLEDEAYGAGSNDTTPQDLDKVFLTIPGGDGEKAAVRGAVEFPGDDFESGELGNLWLTKSYPEEGQRIEATPNLGTAAGDYALWMDRTGETLENGATSAAIWTVDLTAIENPILGFWHASWESSSQWDSSSPIPVPEYIDGIMIGSEYSAYPIWRPPSQPVGEWEYYTLNLTELAADLDYEIGPNTRIIFNWYGNSSVPTEGRGFDEIALFSDQPVEDWYRFTLEDGQSASLSLATAAESVATIDLYDAQRTLLVSSVAANEWETAIEGFKDRTTDGSATEYLVRVAINQARETEMEYQLVVTRDATLETEASDPSATPDKELPSGDVALGYLADSGTSDAAEKDAEDFYVFQAAAGDTLAIETSTPNSGIARNQNLLDPQLELYDSSGALMAENDNGASDSRNARLAQTINTTGTYRLRIAAAAGTAGEYLLKVYGRSPYVAVPFEAVSANMSDPDDTGSTLPLDITFNDEVLWTSVDPSDVKVNGVEAISVERIDERTARYGVAALGVGTWQVTMAAGSVRDVQGTALRPYQTVVVTPTTETVLPGSLIHRSEIEGNLTSATEQDGWNVLVQAGQTLAVEVVPSGSLAPAVAVLNSSGTPVATAAGSAGKAALIQEFVVPTSGEYRIAIGVDSGSGGAYQGIVVVNAGIEEERASGQANNTPATAEDLDGRFQPTPDGMASRAGVVGSLPPGSTIIAMEDFEGTDITDQENPWVLETSNWRKGKVNRARGSGSFEGNGFLRMREVVDDKRVRLEATWTVDLSGQTEPLMLSFWHYQENDRPLPFVHDDVAIAYADGIAISSDGVNWFPAWDIPDLLDSDWTFFSFDLSAAAAESGITLGEGFQIKFLHVAEDTTRRETRAFDNIVISTPNPTEDWYKFSLSDGQSASVALEAEGSGTLALYDSQDNLLAATEKTENVTQRLHRVVDTTTDGGVNTYYVRVSGTDTEYSLIVTRDAEFESQHNNTFENAQNLDNSTIVLGHVGHSYTWTDPGIQSVGADDTVGPISLISSFDGADYRGADTVPLVQADPAIAVGPNHLVTVIGSTVLPSEDIEDVFSQAVGELAVYDKVTGAELYRLSMYDFLAPTGSSSRIGEPRLVFDPYSNRFIAAMVERVGIYPDGDPNQSYGQGYLHLAVSKSDTPVTPDDWYRLTVNITHDPGDSDLGTDPHYPTNPMLATDKNALWITGSYAPVHNDGSGTYAGIVGIDKAALLAGELPAIVYEDYFHGAPPVPVSALSESETQYFLQSTGNNGDSLTIYAVRNMGGEYVRSATSLDVPAYEPTDLLTTKDSSLQIDTYVPNFSSAVWRNGSIWASHSIKDPTAEDDEALVRWYEIGMNEFPNGTPDLIQWGNVDPGPGIHAWNPAVSVDRDGNMAIGFLTAGPQSYLSAAYTGRLASDPLGETTMPVSLLAEGQGPYDVQSSGTTLLAVQSGLAIDPTDHATFWAHNVFATDDHVWNSRIGAFQLDVTTGDDWYQFTVAAGETISLETFAADPSALGSAGDLDPALELYDPEGNLVASDRDGSVDRKNAQLVYTATTAGSWRVRLIGENGSFGAYSLMMDRTGLAPLVEVESARADKESSGTSMPTSWILTFSEPIRDASVQAADLKIAGNSATAVERIGLQTYRYTIDSPANTGDGTYTVEMAAGAVTGVNGRSNVPYERSFTVDSVGPRIQQVLLNDQAASPGKTLSEGTTTIAVHFDEDLPLFVNDPGGPLGPQHVGIELVETISGTIIEPTAVTYDPAQKALTIEIDHLGQGSYTLTLRSAADTFADYFGHTLDGNSDGTLGDDYRLAFTVDRSVSETWVLEQADPLGSLILLGRDRYGWINQAGDEDGYAFFAEAGTTIAAVARPQNVEAKLTVELVGLTGAATASAPGQEVALEPFSVSADGIVTLRITGDTSTQFDLMVTGNAVIETGDSDNAAPLPIDTSRYDAGMGRAAVVGVADPGDADVYTIDMNGRSGERLDVILVGHGEVDMSGAVLDILDMDGNTVLALTGGQPTVRNSLNYDLGIQDFIVPADGVYSIRISANVAGQYALMVTSSTVFDTETSATDASDSREIEAGGSALGHIGAETPLLFAVEWKGNGASLIHTIDTLTGTIINTVDAPIASSANPYGLNLAFDGYNLYYNAGARYGDNRIFVLDARDGTVLREYRATETGVDIYGLAYLGGELFVMDGEGEELDAYSAATGEYLRTIPSPTPHLTGLSGDRSTGALYGVDQQTYTVMQIDPLTGDVLQSNASRIGAAQGMAVMGDELYVSHTGGPGSLDQEIAVYDAGTMQVVRRFRVAVPEMLAGLGGDGIPALFEIEAASPAVAAETESTFQRLPDEAAYFLIGMEESDDCADDHEDHIGLCCTCMVGYGGDDEPTPPSSDRLSDEASNPLILEETERNDTLAQAMAVPLGLEASESAAILVNGELGDADDTDKFRVELDAGDVISVRMSGGAERVALRDSRGFILMSSVYDAGQPAPENSPVSSAGRAALSSIVSTPGTYYVDVFDGEGDYFLDLQVLRPELESQPLGSHQILYLDFDGASVDTSEFVSDGDVRTLSPLVDFLPRWGLDPENDLNAVIDAILLTVEENMSLDVREAGFNGDFDASGVPGQFDIEILNSRDHGEQFGNPNVSRVVVGGTMSELGISTIGIAGSIDVGNFNTEESAVVLLDYISDPEPSSYNTTSLNLFPIAPSSSMVEFVGTAVGNIVSHEAGHFFASWHTWNRNQRNELMDSGGNAAGLFGVGEDGIFGTDDDIDVDFGFDTFAVSEPFQGLENTLAGLAFGLSTGTRDPARVGPEVDELDLNVPVGERSIIDQLTLHFTEELQAASANNSANYVLIHAGANGVFEDRLFDDRVVPLSATYDGENTIELTVDASFAPLAPGCYELTIAGHDTGIVDTNGNPLNAVDGLGTGTPSSFRFDVSVPRNADVYTLNVMVEDTVTLWTETPLDHPQASQAEPLDPSLRVLAPSGNWIAADDSSASDERNALLTFRASESGTYLVYVAAESGEGSYVVRSEVEEGPPSVMVQVPTQIAANYVDSIFLTFTHDIDPATFSLAEDLLRLEGPDGAITPTGHSWKSPRELEISFPVQTNPGDYAFELAPTIVSGAGHALDQDLDGTPGEAGEDHYVGAFSLVSATEFGYVLYDDLEGLNPSSGELAYRLTATHSGYLSVAADAPDHGTLLLRLQSEATGEQVTSTVVDGKIQIDLPMLADGHAILYVSGTTTDVDLKLVNLVQHEGKTVTVHGTDGTDQFEMDASSEFSVSINGVSYALAAAEVELIAFDGGLGDDTARLTGTSGNEKAILHPDHGEMEGAGWKVTVAGVVSTELVGDGGLDSVQMYDSVGDDHYESAPGLTTLSGPGYLMSAADFTVCHGYGKAGGTDTAAIHGAEGERVKFKSYPDVGMGKLYGGGFFSRAKFFETMEVMSHGENSLARLFDTQGDDTCSVQMDESSMVSPGFVVTVYGFTQFAAYSLEGGYDTATIVDSPLDDEVRFRGHKVQMYDPTTNGDVYNLAVRAFDEVHAHATQGGYDRAKLHDTAGDELFDVTGNTARMSTQKAEMELLYEAVDFEFVKAYRSQGNDRTEVAEEFDFVLNYEGDWL